MRYQMTVMKSLSQLLLCGFLCISSAVMIIYIKHESREIFIELEELSTTRDKLNIEWSALQAEENKWATPMRIETEAIENLNFYRPIAPMIRVFQRQ